MEKLGFRCIYRFYCCMGSGFAVVFRLKCRYPLAQGLPRCFGGGFDYSMRVRLHLWFGLGLRDDFMRRILSRYFAFCIGGYLCWCHEPGLGLSDDAEIGMGLIDRSIVVILRFSIIRMNLRVAVQ